MEQKKRRYEFPHDLQSWPYKRNILESALKSNCLEQAIQSLNRIKNSDKYQAEWTAKSLIYDSESPSDVLLLLKFIIQKALQVQKLFPNEINISTPLPLQGSNRSWIILNRLQCCSIIANMFLSLVEPQKNRNNLPIYINFAKLSRRPNQINKTILLYFRKIRKYEQQNKEFLTKSHVVFIRVSETKSIEHFMQSQLPLCDVRYHTQGTIEDEVNGIQIDFANKSIGGFFLAHTFTQQDIIFINNPENIPAILFHEFMGDHQAIILVGSERVATYQGYLETYRFDKQYNDQRPFVKLKVSEEVYVENVRDHWISAIDAIPVFYSKQFTVKCTLRELNKAYCGFLLQNLDGAEKVVSTGNWGSGAFGGNLHYKFLEQWIAASAAGRAIDYYSFNNPDANPIPDVVKMCRHLTVGEFTKIILNLSEKLQISRRVFPTLKQHMIDTQEGIGNEKSQKDQTESNKKEVKNQIKQAKEEHVDQKNQNLKKEQQQK